MGTSWWESSLYETAQLFKAGHRQSVEQVIEGRILLLRDSVLAEFISATNFLFAGIAVRVGGKGMETSTESLFWHDTTFAEATAGRSGRRGDRLFVPQFRRACRSHRAVEPS